MLGPQNTSSSRVTASYTDTLFWILTLSPMATSLPTNTFWPNEQPAPMRAPPLMCTQCQTRQSSPRTAPSSTMAVGWIVVAISVHKFSVPALPLVLASVTASVFEGQVDPAAVARRQVHRDQQFERLQ